MNRRIQRVFNDLMSSKNLSSEKAEGAFAPWFERFPDRLMHEGAMLSSNSIEATFTIMKNGRVAVSFECGKKNVVMVCSYHHPIAPPDVYVFNDSSRSDGVDNNSMDIFERLDISWSPDVTLADIATAIANHLDAENHETIDDTTVRSESTDDDDA